MGARAVPGRMQGVRGARDARQTRQRACLLCGHSVDEGGAADAAAAAAADTESSDRASFASGVCARHGSFARMRPAEVAAAAEMAATSWSTAMRRTCNRRLPRLQPCIRTCAGGGSHM